MCNDSLRESKTLNDESFPYGLASPAVLQLKGIQVQQDDPAGVS